ncbi:MAG: ribonuclease HII [Bacteroidota bacterium]
MSPKNKLQRYPGEPPIVGTDEAGRGCLAGPVTAACIVLPPNFENALLNDSKQLSKGHRATLKPILEQAADFFKVVHVHEAEIDKLNILNASLLAMHRCLEAMPQLPNLILVDGNRFKPFRNIPHQCVVKGDSKYLSIAAASVLAKTYRDAFMAKLHEEYPMYNWISNKGYPTAEHRAAIRQYGITPYHRKTFKQLPEQLTFGFGETP